jgi:hypothetical protein
VRTIDAIDSTQNQVGDRFQASLEEPLRMDGNEIVSRDAAVYGRLAESKESGTFTGRSQLRLDLTALVVNGQTVPIVTGDYELTGKSRGASDYEENGRRSGGGIDNRRPRRWRQRCSDRRRRRRGRGRRVRKNHQ